MRRVKIFFDEPTHTYTDEEGSKYTSVTTVIDKYKEKFDKVFWAYYRAVDQTYGRFGSPRPDTEGNRIFCKTDSGDRGTYYSIQDLRNGALELNTHPDVINLSWAINAEEACIRGTREHNYLEDSINNLYEKKNITPSLTVNELPSFSLQISSIVELENSPLTITHKEVFEVLKGLINKGYVLYAEKRVYSYDHKVSGTIDILAVDSEGNFWIVDWKTNKDVLQFKSGYFKQVWDADRTVKVKTDEWVDTDKRMLYPVDDLQVCKGNIYTLQLSLYARLCELWGLRCKGLILCHLRIEMVEGKEVHHEPIFYDIPYLGLHADRLLEDHKSKIVKTKNNFRKPVKY